MNIAYGRRRAAGRGPGRHRHDEKRAVLSSIPRLRQELAEPGNDRHEPYRVATAMIVDGG